MVYVHVCMGISMVVGFCVQKSTLLGLLGYAVPVDWVVCDRIWENLAYSKFYEFLVSYIYMTSSTIELTYLEVSDQSHASHRS